MNVSDWMPEVIAVVVGLAAGWAMNRLIVREPGYVITDPSSLPEDADPALLDELEEVGELPDIVPLTLLRPRAWTRRWFPMVEVAAVLSLVLTVQRYSSWSTRVAVGFLMLALVTLSAIDIRVYRLPDRINLPAAVVGALLIMVASVERGLPRAITGMAIGGVFYVTLMFLAHLAYPRGMGFGDVKLSWLMGFYLGWIGWRSGDLLTQTFHSVQFVLYGAVVGSLCGVVVGIPVAIFQRSARAVFPYGPSLAFGCAVIVLYGRDVVPT